ncbi:MAG: hypothetical protein M3Z33_02175 [Actinomycetota bacterium]|nr:hypothetical protein [Actinomycetota bacterium]
MCSGPDSMAWQKRLRFWARRGLGDLREAARRRWFRLAFMRRRLRRRAFQAWQEGTIGFVCFGNICRSPFAERLAAQHLDRGRRTLSAGYFPESGRRAPALAVTVAGRLGVDLEDHRSRLLDDDFVELCDSIFVFDEDNYRTLVREHPAAKGRVHFLGALSEHEPLFVPDPFGGQAEDYELIYGRISRMIARVGASAPPPSP